VVSDISSLRTKSVSFDSTDTEAPSNLSSFYRMELHFARKGVLELWPHAYCIQEYHWMRSALTFVKYNLLNVFRVVAGLQDWKTGREEKHGCYWPCYVRIKTYIRQNHDNCIQARNNRILCGNLISKYSNPLAWTTHNWERGDPRVGVFVWGDWVGGFSVAWNSSPQGPGGEF
jgi:hypothetical protein